MALINCNFRSKVLGEQMNISVILPSGEEGKKLVCGNEKFRVLYLLHGGSDDCTSYYRYTSIEQYAMRGNFAVVCPEVRNSFYCDMQYGLKYFTYISEELPKVVESLFPISKRREDHFVIGNSMGSHGALKWALRRPDFFAAAAGMSGVAGLEELGYISRLKDGKGRNKQIHAAFGAPEDYFGSENDLKHLAEWLVASKKPIPKLFSCCGTDDFTLEGCREYACYAHAIGLPLEYMEGAGGHEWDFWDFWLKYYINRFELEEV